jgi:protease IV
MTSNIDSTGSIGATPNTGDPKNTVAVVDIKGVIDRTQVADFFGNTTDDMVTIINKKLDEAINDDNIKAVILRVDSPGGEVYATRMIYNKILELKAKEKPVVVVMESMAASGGYYVSAPADWIIASEITTTGSIGVVMGGLDFKGVYEKLGIKEFYITNTEGDLKVVTDYSDPNSEGYKVLQSILDDVYNNFVGVIAEGRDMSVTEVKKIADGRVYSGKQAVANGLADEIGEFDLAVEKVKELANLENPRIKVLEVQQKTPGLFGFSLPAMGKLQNLDANTTKYNVRVYYILYI